MSDTNYYYSEIDNRWVIELKGDIDVYTAQQFREVIHSVFEQKIADILLDCYDLNYMDSTGLGVLIGALKRLKEHEKSIILNNVKPNIKK